MTLSTHLSTNQSKHHKTLLATVPKGKDDLDIVFGVLIHDANLYDVTLDEDHIWPATFAPFTKTTFKT